MEKKKKHGLHITPEFFSLKDEISLTKKPLNKFPFMTIKYKKKHRTLLSVFNKNNSDNVFTKIDSNDNNREFKLNVDVKPIINAKNLNIEFKKYLPLKKEKIDIPNKKTEFNFPKINKEYLEKVRITEYYIKSSDITKDPNDINKHLIILRNHMLHTFYLEQMSKICGNKNNSLHIKDTFIVDDIEEDLKTFPYFKESMLNNVEGLLRSVGTSSCTSYQAKKPIFKEAKTNEFFYKVLDKICKKVIYLKENNHQIGYDTVFNLMYEEIQIIKNKLSNSGETKKIENNIVSKTTRNLNTFLKGIREETEINEFDQKMNVNLANEELIHIRFQNSSSRKSFNSKKNIIDSGNITTFSSTQVNYFKASKNSSERFSRNYDKYHKTDVLNSNMILTDKNKTTEKSESKVVSTDNFIEKNWEHNILKNLEDEKKITKNIKKNDSKKKVNSLKKLDHFNSKQLKKIKAKNIYKKPSKNNDDISNLHTLTTNPETYQSNVLKSEFSSTTRLEKKESTNNISMDNKDHIKSNSDIKKQNTVKENCINLNKGKIDEENIALEDMKLRNARELKNEDDKCMFKNEHDNRIFNNGKTIIFKDPDNTISEKEKGQIKKNTEDFHKKVSFLGYQEQKSLISEKKANENKVFKLNIKPSDLEIKSNDIKNKGNKRKSKYHTNNLNNAEITDDISELDLDQEYMNSDSNNNLIKVSNLEKLQSRKSFLRTNILINNNIPNENNINIPVTPSPIGSKLSTSKLEDNILRSIKEESSSNSNRESIISAFQSRNSLINKLRKQSQIGLIPVFNPIFENEKERTDLEAKIKLLDENLSNNQIEEIKSSLNNAKLNSDFYSHSILRHITEAYSTESNETLDNLKQMKIDINSYIENFDNGVIKDEIQNIHETKEIENRINDFLYNLKDYRFKKKLMMSTFDKSLKVHDNRPKNKLCPILNKEEFTINK